MSQFEESIQKSESAFDNFNIDALNHFIAENTKIIDEIEFENLMFERYVKKFDIKIDSVDEDKVPNDAIRVTRKRSRSRGAGADRALKLTPEQKCAIAQVEIEDYKQETIGLQTVSEKIIDNYSAIVEETDMQLHDLKKCMHSFEKDIIKGAYLPRYHAIMSEKLVRFLEDYLRARDTLVDKLRLKNTTLRLQKKKLHAQLRQKEEMGEILHEVDFEQLKIENAQCLSAIDIKNQELLRLKLAAGKTLQALNTFRKQLHGIIYEANLLKIELKSREELTKRTKIDIQSSQKDKENVGLLTNALKKLIDEYSVPESMDYVRCVQRIELLKRKQKIQERKVAIAQIALKRHRRVWKEANRTTNVLLKRQC